MYCCNSFSNGSFANVQYNDDLVLEDKQNIPFNIIVSNNGFTINNGTLTANKSGNYIIMYHLNVEGTSSSLNLITEILVNGNVVHKGIGNALVSQFSGSTALHINQGDTIQLINATGEELEITFANFTIYGI